MANIDWTTIGTIASTAAVVMSGFLWVITKVFRLGQTTQRLDSIESDIQHLRTDLHTGLTSVNQRIDKLILTISQSNRT